MLATVKGDVHDIGKNLVDIICTNNGYEVHNLGIKVAIGEMVAKVKEVDADALGMSGLLVKSTLIMRDNLEELNALGLAEIPVLLGGAALTRRYVERDLREIYEGRLFYGRDAFEGLSHARRADGHEAQRRVGPRLRAGADGPRAARARPTPTPRRRRAAPPLARRRPPTTRCSCRRSSGRASSRASRSTTSPSTSTRPRCSATSGSSGPRRTPPASPRATTSSRPASARRSASSSAAAKASGVLVPQVVYGYFPANGDGDDLVVWTDESRTTEAARFHYPRQKVEPFLCIADFFRPIESGEVDYAAFHIVTMGAAVSEATAELFAANEYQQYLLLHGLGVEMAEALAEYWHRRIREEWGFVDEDGPTVGGLFRQQYRGGRYSWGYPACPDLEDNATVAGLLGADRLGIEVARGDRLAVPARADDLGDHLPPPAGQVLRRPLSDGHDPGGAPHPRPAWRRVRRAPRPRRRAALDGARRHDERGAHVRRTRGRRVLDLADVRRARRDRQDERRGRTRSTVGSCAWCPDTEVVQAVAFDDRRPDRRRRDDDHVPVAEAAGGDGTDVTGIHDDLPPGCVARGPS